MSYKTYFRFCLFLPLLVPLPFLLLKGAGFHTPFIATLVFGMPPYIIFIAIPLSYLYGKFTEKQVIISLCVIPVLLPPVFGLFWLIIPHFIENVSVSFTNHFEWIFITFVAPLLYSTLYICGNLIRKKLNKR